MPSERPEPPPENRELTAEERTLAQWLLTHGAPDASSYLPQLQQARVVARCACGCASIGLEVAGERAPNDGQLQILGDFVYGAEATLAGIFIFARGGLLAGIEVYGLAGDAPRSLPPADALRPFPSQRLNGRG